MKLFVTAAFLCALAVPALSQLPMTNGGSGPVLPENCVPGSTFSKLDGIGGIATFNFCNLSGAWVELTSGGGGIPSGAIIMISSGSCPSGFTEDATLVNRYVVFTRAANGDVGTTGGSATLTATGTNSQPTFTGNALGSHAHELPFYKVAGGTGAFRMIPQTVFGSGTSRAAESTDTSSANTTAGAVALSQSVSAGTPAGTVSAPIFAGSPVTNQPSFVKMIPCRKD